MKIKPRVLFLCHSASRNGATILLLHFLQWLREQVDWEIEILVNGRGPLLNELKSVAKTTVWRNPTALLKTIRGKRMAALQSRLEALSLNAMLLGRRFDLIYANTAGTWNHVSSLRRRTCSILWHIHEMEYALQVLLPEGRAKAILRSATGFVAVSNAVRDTLVRHFEVPAHLTAVVNGFVPVADLASEERRSRRERVIRELGWSEDTFVVGGCGSLGWRKGTDVFLQIADALRASIDCERVRFLWLGGETAGDPALEFAHDVRALGLQGVCQRVSANSNVLDYYCSMDAFALTSREDPFPLVMLEAGSLGIPVVCFAGSGGAQEFVQDDAGLIAPYLNVSAFADHLIRLNNLPLLRQSLGAAARSKVKANHTAATQAPKLRKLIERCLYENRITV